MILAQREVAAMLAIQEESNTISCTPLGLQELQGVSVSLIRSGPEHTNFIYDCYQNSNFMSLYRLAQNRKLSKQEISEHLVVEQSKLPQELRRIEWIIIKRDSQQPIGIAALADQQVSHRRAEFLLGMPDKQHRKGLLSVEASLLALDFAFNHANLHKVISFVYGYNSYAQKNTLHLGFTQEGILHEHIQSNEGFIDLFQNGMLKTRFLNNRLLSKLSLRLIHRDITQPKQSKISPVSQSLMEKFNSQVKKIHS